jgi:hypothetical protein
MENNSAAVECYEKSLKIQEVLPSPNHASMAIIYFNTARAYEDLQNCAAALKHAERSVNSARLAYGSDPSKVKDYQNLVDRLRNKQ